MAPGPAWANIPKDDGSNQSLQLHSLRTHQARGGFTAPAQGVLAPTGPELHEPKVAPWVTRLPRSRGKDCASSTLYSCPMGTKPRAHPGYPDYRHFPAHEGRPSSWPARASR
jgi:hypothetical protein